MTKLIKKIKINTSLRLLSGLHIGAGDSSIEIGGIDNPVIKLVTRESQPYIPGSSLKGKMRCLLEQIYGISEVGGKGNNKSVKCIAINNLFGFSGDNMPSKIIVRDSYLSDKSLELLKISNLDMPYTEGKWENSVSRIAGTAKNPRLSERVPADVEFDVEFIINVWDNDNEDELISLLDEGIKAIENDYLGGSGSRGYGQVKFGERKRQDILFNNND